MLPSMLAKRKSDAIESEDEEQSQNKRPKPSPNNVPLPDEILRKYTNESEKCLIDGLLKWEFPGRSNAKNYKIYGRSVPGDVIDLSNYETLYKHVFNDSCEFYLDPHIVLITTNNKVLTFGKNNFGQLGHGKASSVVCKIPTKVKALDEVNIISAAIGSRHTLFLTDTGSVYACGDNSKGQCGIGLVSDHVLVPELIDYWGPPIVKIGCGANFSIILDKEGSVYAFGAPEYGQLGNGTNGETWFRIGNKWHPYEPSPRRINVFMNENRGNVGCFDDIKIVDFSCGTNHTVAIDSEKRVFSWGSGGDERLGHLQKPINKLDRLLEPLLPRNKDEQYPRIINYFQTANNGLQENIGKVYCGPTWSMLMTESDPRKTYIFGKYGENEYKYPTPIEILDDWKITDICFQSMFITADSVNWEADKKFGSKSTTKSTVPAEIVKDMFGTKVIQVTMGRPLLVLS